MSWIKTAGSARRPNSWVRRVFHERQIYLRSENEIQFIRLTPVVQIFSLVILLATLCWTAYASVNILFKDQLLALKEQRMEEARLDFEARVDEIRTSLDKVNDRLLLDQGGYLRKIDDVRAEYEQLVQQHERLVSFFRKGWIPLRDQVLTDEPKAQTGKSSFNDLNGSFAEKYAADFKQEEEVLRPLSDMRVLYTNFHTMQAELLKEASAYTASKVRKANSLRLSLGIPAVPEPGPNFVRAESTGGPFISAAIANEPRNLVEERISEVTGNVQVLERIKGELAALPLTKPVPEDSEITSGFGYRSDPLRRIPAFHAGADFRGNWGAEVNATASGIVTNAGWDGAYGRLVEISHDNGVTTRYAHLSGVAVAVGQRVQKGTVVGRIGNTGRSTGPHLHYETRVNGQAIDPVRFWRMSDDLQALSTE